MPTFSFDVQVPSGFKPILHYSWGCSSYKPNTPFPIGGSVLQIFVQPPGEIERELAALDITDCQPEPLGNIVPPPLPPLRTPPGNSWQIVPWNWGTMREIEPCVPESDGLYVVRIQGLWYLSSDSYTFPNESRPSHAFETFYGAFWSNPENTTWLWPTNANFNVFIF